MYFCHEAGTNSSRRDEETREHEAQVQPPKNSIKFVESSMPTEKRSVASFILPDLALTVGSIAT